MAYIYTITWATWEARSAPVFTSTMRTLSLLEEMMRSGWPARVAVRPWRRKTFWVSMWTS